ncbi:MAG: aminoacyl-tRNA hydrolase [Candidatus Binatia bacterium]
MKAILGLGNPGKKYERTRHNLGFLVLDRVASENGIAVRKKRCNSLIGEWRRDGEEILLIKPQTYMNQSGKAVKHLVRSFPVAVKDLVVIHDDLDLPFGRIRLRPRGGAAGHRGVLSILETLGEEGFFRVRVGIGRPSPGVDPTDFVLEPFSPEEKTRLDEVISRAADAIECLLGEGSRGAMEKFNRAD